MKLTILGTGCPKCATLAESVETAARELGIDYEMEKITDVAEIARYGVMRPPALAVDGVVVSYGKTVGVEEAKQLLSGSGKSGGCGCGCGSCGC